MKNVNHGRQPSNKPIIMPKLDFNKLNIGKEAKQINIHKINNQVFQSARSPSHVALDYAFKFHKAKIQSKEKDKVKMEEYVYDLENTWTLNIDIFQNMLADFSPYSNDQKKSLNLITKRIKHLFEKKKILRQDKQKLRGKVLMDKQIMEEYKRRNEENHAYYQEQVDEIRENLDKKDSFMKQFEKKFNEVEIYVQREAKNTPDKWDAFLTFEILAFIDNNEMLNRRKIKINDDTAIIKEEMNEVLRENVQLKKRDECVDMSEDFESEKSKYSSLIKLYQSKIKFLERNSEHLKNVYKSISNKLENITLYNNDLSEKLKTGNTKPLAHRKMNSIAAIPSNKQKLKNRDAQEKMNNEKEVNEAFNESYEEANDKNSSEGDKKSQVEIFKMKRDHSELIEDHSMIVKTPDFNMNKENWDISCIENFPDA